MKASSGIKMFGVFCVSPGSQAGRRQFLQVPCSVPSREGLLQSLALCPPPGSVCKPRFCNPPLGFHRLCDYVAGAGAEWSGRNGTSVCFVLLTGQRTAPEKQFLLSTLSMKEHIEWRPVQSSLAQNYFCSSLEPWLTSWPTWLTYHSLTVPNACPHTSITVKKSNAGPFV